MFRNVVAALLLGLGMAMGFTGPATAQTPDERARELEILIESLKERIEALEAEVDAIKSEAERVREEADAQAEAEIESASAPAPEDFRVYWRDGLRFETQDGKYKLRIGGRLQFDAAWFDQDDELWLVEDTEDGAEFRRARLYVSGEVYENVEFKMQYDFAGSEVAFKDVYVAIGRIPYAGKLKAGHFKEPFSLEELTSSKHITFMERALPNVFAPSRNLGVQLSNNHFNERMQWAVGIFRESGDDAFAADDGDYNVTARMSGLPLYMKDGRYLIHLGGSYTHKKPDDPVRIRQRPEAHLSPVRWVSTPTVRTEETDIYALEAAAVIGPFSLQGEYFRYEADTTLEGDVTFDGWYAQASYFITGEHRPYKKPGGIFDNVKPKRNFKFTGENKGPGAWEVAVRYSTLDLDSTPFIGGGEEDNVTLGVNWYMNPVTRFTVNYVMADIDHPLYDADLNILQTRLQFAF